MKQVTLSHEMQHISIFQQRKIELGVLAPLYKEMINAVGPETAKEIMQRTVSGLARNVGAEWAKSHPERDLEGIRAIWQKLADGKVLDAEIRELPEGLEITVRRCDYATMYGEAGLEELGHILSCSRDEPFTEGFSDHITFSRSSCLLEGDECCIMKYGIKENTPK
ncbi:MAG: L-2-amino-thiazoline-4-carboxylic acid hydrolase [Chlorobiaceae bacterium]|nr:L-2-amino-thiazoline-4-carboxylic acid hydrolase [Chlorobiaceae bacterium]